MVAGRIAEKRAVVELGRAHDLAGIEQALGIEPVLDLLERVHEPRPEHLLVKLRAHDAIAMFTRMGALVGTHECERLLGEGAHRLYILVEPQVEHRPHMQAADRRMRVPGAAGAVLRKDVGEF